MTAYIVERVVPSAGSRPIPRDASVYIRQANPRAGVFRCDPTGSWVFQMVGTGAGTWTPVRERLSVDTTQTYNAFWLEGSGCANLPSSVLQQALHAGPPNPYTFTPTAADAQAHRIRVPYFQRVRVEAIIEEGPVYLRPGFEVVPQGNFMNRPVNYFLRTRWQTSAVSGYLIQAVVTQMDVRSCSGTKVNIPTEHYWEAWRITGPNQFDPNAFDHWTIEANIGTRNTQGTWTKTGNVFWVPALLPEWKFRAGGARGAGQLLSTTMQPQHLGPPLLSRREGGRWNGCAENFGLNSHDPN